METSSCDEYFHMRWKANGGNGREWHWKLHSRCSISCKARPGVSLKVKIIAGGLGSVMGKKIVSLLRSLLHQLARKFISSYRCIYI